MFHMIEEVGKDGQCHGVKMIKAPNILFLCRFPLTDAPMSEYTEYVTGYSAVWLARLLWEQEVPGSNPGTPTTWLHASLFASNWTTAKQEVQSFYAHSMNSIVNVPECSRNSSRIPTQL